MIIRNRRRVEPAQQAVAAAATIEAEMDDVLLEGLDEPREVNPVSKGEQKPEPAPVEQSGDSPAYEVPPAINPHTLKPFAPGQQPKPKPKGTKGNPKPTKRRGPGRPRKHEAVERWEKVALPDGMTDGLLAWACGLGPNSNSVYRWRTGQIRVPDSAVILIQMWKDLGKDKFLEVVSHARGSYPSEKAMRPKFKRKGSVETYIEVILKGREGGASTSEIYEALQTEHHHSITKGSLRTMMSRLKQKGVVSGEGETGSWEPVTWKLTKV
jgi:hypothetical protein